MVTSKSFYRDAGVVFAGIFLVGVFLYVLLPGNISITGRAGSGSGLVGLTVLAPEINIDVISPENTTYNFGIGDDYNISLNVTADFSPQAWWYNLYDVRHGYYVNESVLFTPNITIQAVRWDNRLEVFANHTVGVVDNENVTFYVSVPNSAPILGDIDDVIYTCEDDTLSYYFNATDEDENAIIYTDINPKDPFYVSPVVFSYKSLIESYIISEDFTKSDVGSHIETISVSDTQYADTKIVNITIIEVNNPPVVGSIGSQTVWSNDTFYKKLVVDDVESGDENSGNFSYDLTFTGGEQFFDITYDGVMTFDANSSNIGSYNITVCVTDRALESVSPNISLCGQDGLNQTTCQTFNLVVTDSNREPTIVSYYPSSVGSTAGTSALYFNVSKVDPDGSLADTYWYVDSSLKEIDSGSNFDSFTYTFGCGVSGNHIVEAVITDGELNDSVFWSFAVVYVECPQAPEGSGGGGGGGGGGSTTSRCSNEWVCDNWDICQNVEASLGLGVVSGTDYRATVASCDDKGLLNDICGIQIRSCYDLNACNTTFDLPEEFQSCYYIEEPSCFDGVKNCHDDDCELLVDCGGPCRACSTCSDKVQNQGEQGVDCGGPCPWKCVEKVPFVKEYFVEIVLGLLLILIIFAVWRIFKIVKLRRELEKKPRRRKNAKL